MWTYQAKQTNLIRAIIFRPIDGSVRNEFQIVGFNDISVTSIDTTVTYIVPESERIMVNVSDVIGWSGNGLAFNIAGQSQYLVKFLQGYTPSDLDVDQVLNFNNDDEWYTRDYSIEAEVRT